MKRTLEQLREGAIDIPLTTQMRQRAKAVGNDRVGQNVLAVLAVAEYLEQWQGYTIDLEQSDVWNPLLQRLNVADLSIAGLGRLECRSLRFGETLPEIPPEVWYDRIGYVYVELQPEFAKLLGFVLPFDPEQGDAGEIESIDQLLEHLERLAIAVPIVEAELAIYADQRLAIVVQLERIYRMERSSRWGLRAEEVLAERLPHRETGKQPTVSAVREEAKESPEWIARQELAERLMEKLATVWNELRG